MIKYDKFLYKDIYKYIYIYTHTYIFVSVTALPLCQEAEGKRLILCPSLHCLE